MRFSGVLLSVFIRYLIANKRKKSTAAFALGVRMHVRSEQKPCQNFDWALIWLEVSDFYLVFYPLFLSPPSELLL